jgi:hypothetical protein
MLVSTSMSGGVTVVFYYFGSFELDAAARLLRRTSALPWSPDGRSIAFLRVVAQVPEDVIDNAERRCSGRQRAA